jgi:magnesium-transporting ATPase (P-type)
MTTIHQVGDQLPVANDRSPFIAFVKGAPDVILEHCEGYVQDGQVKPLTDAKRQEILAANDDMARQALREFKSFDALFDFIKVYNCRRNFI